MPPSFWSYLQCQWNWLQKQFSENCFKYEILFPGINRKFRSFDWKKSRFFSKMDASKKAHTINMSLLCVKCRHGLRPNTLLASNIAKREAQHLRFSQNWDWMRFFIVCKHISRHFMTTPSYLLCNPWLVQSIYG